MENVPIGNKPRVKLFEIPVDGICVRFKDGHEEYIRSCPNCGHRLEVRTSSGMLPQWFCPVERGRGSCNWTGEAVAEMSPAVASEFADIRMTQECHACKGKDLEIEVHRRRSRIEILLRHPQGHACKAEHYMILHTLNENAVGEQKSSEALGKFDKDVITRLPTWTPSEVEKKILESQNQNIDPRAPGGGKTT